MKKNYQQVVIIIFLLIILLNYLINSSLIITEVLSYTELFVTRLFPVSLTFFIIASLLIDYGIVDSISKLFHINGAGFFTTLMSLISGFPSGAKYTKELLDKKIIDADYANYLIKFTHFPNPLFVLGSVNLVINNMMICIYLLISIIISNLFVSFIYKTRKKASLSYDETELKSFSFYLQKAILSSFKTIILIYGTSLFFYLISVFIGKYLLFNNYGYVILMGVFDLTKGVFSAARLGSLLLKSILILIFISFGGISIHMQVKSIITGSEIKYSNFFKGRLVATFIATVIFLLIIYWTNYINGIFFT